MSMWEEALQFFEGKLAVPSGNGGFPVKWVGKACKWSLFEVVEPLSLAFGVESGFGTITLDTWIQSLNLKIDRLHTGISLIAFLHT